MRFPQASASTRPHLRSVFSRALLAVSLAIGSAVVVFTGLAAGPNSKQRSVPEAAKETAPARRDPAKAYGKLPLSFARNRGQANRRVSFIARGPGYGLFLTSDEAVLALRAASPDRSDGDEQEPAANPLKVLRLKFVGANRKVIVEGQNESAGKLNYFIGNNPRHWHTNIPTFSQVRYRNAYPGVDLVYHGNQQQLEYDFLVAPGASPQQIRLAFTGAQKISVDSNGDLVLDTGAGEVYQHKPIAYQEVNGERREVAVKYKLEGNDVTFETGGYDQQRRLVIDPIFVFSSFLGGVSAEQGLGIAVDAQGSAYLTGSTTSTDFPVPGGPETVKAAFNDAFVVKLNAAGTALVYGTYFGGNGDDLGNAIAIDAQGNAYVVGSTGSNNLPATSDVAGNGKDSLLDGFATKISPSGSSIVYSKYLGGNNTDSAYGVAVDADGRAYVTGRTDSAIFRIPFREPRHGSPLHKSDNNGGQWTPSARNLFGSTVNSITLDPSQSNTVYAATTNGAFKSVDAGTGWNKTGISHHSAIPTNIFAVVVDPSNPAIVYLGGTDGFYKSTDGGVEYDLKETGFPTPLVRSLAIDPISPTTLYAATQQGMYKTTNSGFNNSWVAINNGLGGFIRVSQIVIDPTNPAILYIGTPLNGMFKTTNGGALWTPINSGFNPAFLGPPQVTALAIDPVNPSTLYAGCFVNSNGDIVFKTTNGGTTWTASSSGLSTMINGQPFIPNVNALAVDPVTPTTVYAGVSPGSIFKSTDGGAHWNQSNTGFPNTSATAITVNPGNSAIVYAGTAIGGDAFALRLNAAGTAAEYMFNFGGDENDEARGVALDAAGNAYMVGTTNSQNFPVENPFQPALGAFSDAFVAKLDSSGSGLVYSTYLGGGFGEQGRAIAVQGGSAYVTGQTSSPDFPLVNPFKGLLAQFDTDAFVTKVNPSGNSLGYSTFLGGLGNELGLGIAVGANGEAYVTGLTTSQDFPVLRAPQPMRTNSGNDGFVTQLNSAGSSLGYSTYLGGGNADQGNGIAVDASGNAYVVGTTSSIDFPTA
ncbi:MAG TPA: SBBP repeat-containing protein, partial [Pyrinomonadaceae bacterium]|nr:SBBP repeat-containing protein [Pyrinomonadaceae bacterium]